MVCPNCKSKSMQKLMVLNMAIDYCNKCHGLWFDINELEFAKNKEDANINWVDIDLWRDKKKLEISQGGRLCPRCRMPLYEVQYDKSKVRVDICNLCHGVWLDRGEYKKIIKYLKDKSDYEVLNHAFKNLSQQFWEVFSGPEIFREELSDFISVLKLFCYKFDNQHPYITMTIRAFVPKP